MIKMAMDTVLIYQMRNALGDMSKHLPRHMATSVNRVARSVKVEAAKRVGKVMNIGVHSSVQPYSKKISKAGILKKTILQKGKADKSKPYATITLFGGYAFPLKYLNGREYTRKNKGKTVGMGMRYKPTKGGGGSGWVSVPGAFMVKRFGGHFYKRPGKSRSIGKFLTGVKPSDYFEQTGTEKAVRQLARKRLPIELKRRIREVLLARQGKIKLRATKFGS